MNKIVRMQKFNFVLLDDGLLTEPYISAPDRAMIWLTLEFERNLLARYEHLTPKVRPKSMPTTLFMDPLVKHLNHDEYTFYRDARCTFRLALDQAVAQKPNVFRMNIDSMIPVEDRLFTLTEEIS